MNIYWIIFAALAIIVMVMKNLKPSKGGKNTEGENNLDKTNKLKSLQIRYAWVFLAFKLSDWIQGPYFYEVYKSKEYNGKPISDTMVGYIFLVGFGSSMVFGTFIGGLVDKLGRKKGALLYCGFCFLSVLSTHSNSYLVLLLGRVAGGIATSLLFSVPEAWLVTEHKAGNHDPSWLSDLFSWMYFGDGVVAIIAGLVASWAAGDSNPTGPFDISALVLVVGGTLTFIFWTENYGDNSNNSSSSSSASSNSFGEAIKAIRNDSKMLLLGLIQSLFEGSMYTFVLLWAPAMKLAAIDIGWDTPPFGLIFACFMVGCMLGSVLFGKAMSTDTPVQVLLKYVLLAASVALGVSGLFFDNIFVLLVMFIGFEICVGIYFPTIGTLRSKIIPDNVRATVMNLYRVPLNLIVVAVFMNLDSIGNVGALVVASGALGCGAILQHQLIHELKYENV